MRALFQDTVAELTSRKITVLFIVITALLLLGVWLSIEVRTDLGKGLGVDSSADLGDALQPWVAPAFSKITSIFIFFAVLAAAGLLPRALEKGRAEYLLARPLSRTSIILGKLFSIWLAYGALALTSSLIVYAITAAVHGVFDIRIFLLFAVYAADFLVWVSVIGLAGVLSGSATWSIMAAFGVWLAQALLSYHEFFGQVLKSKLLANIFEGLYYIFPKTGQLGDIGVALANGREVESWLPLWTALLFAAVMVYLAVQAFSRRDY